MTSSSLTPLCESVQLIPIRALPSYCLGKTSVDWKTSCWTDLTVEKAPSWAFTIEFFIRDGAGHSSVATNCDLLAPFHTKYFLQQLTLVPITTPSAPIQVSTSLSTLARRIESPTKSQSSNTPPPINNTTSRQNSDIINTPQAPSHIRQK